MDNSFLHSKRLLLVDDEQELLKMVSDILKDAGFETVLTAMTVKEAILTAKEETPDLILLAVSEIISLPLWTSARLKSIVHPSNTSRGESSL